jgi:capsular polysaccharide biosynthesis protein
MRTFTPPIDSYAQYPLTRLMVTRNPMIPTLDILDELDFLKEFNSLEDLLSDNEVSGRFTLLPPDETRVSTTTQGRWGGFAAPPWWETDRVASNRPLHIFRLRNAYVLPKLGIVISACGHIMKSTYAEAKYLYGKIGDLPYTESNNNGGISFFPPPEASIHDKCIVTMPWGGMHNYGHFLIDCLTSVVTLREFSKKRQWPFLFPTLTKWQRQHLVRLALPYVKELTDDVWFCQNVVWTSNIDHHLQGPNKSLQFLRNTHHFPTEEPTRLLWLSRGNDSKRHYANNNELEQHLQALGFQIVHPEALSPYEQIKITSEAKVVAGFTGAAFANSLFCKPKTVIIEVQPSLMPGVWIRNLAQSIGCEWVPFFCESTPSSVPVVVGGEVRVDIGIEIEFDNNEFLTFLCDLLKIHPV